jgi:hypothetical protein
MRRRQAVVKEIEEKGGKGVADFLVTYVVGNGAGEIHQRIEAESLADAKERIAELLSQERDFFAVETTTGTTTFIWKAALGCVQLAGPHNLEPPAGLSKEATAHWLADRIGQTPPAERLP